MFESLEDRRLMSVTVNNFAVTVNGDDGNVVRDDAIVLRRSSANNFNVEVLMNGQLQLTRAMADIGTLQVNGREGADTLTIDNSNGAIAMRFGAAMNFNGGNGDNSVIIQGGNAGTVTYSAGASDFSGRLTKGQNGQTQMLDFSGVFTVKELSTATQFRFLATSTGTENISLHNGSSSSDGMLRINDTTTTRVYASIDFANKTELVMDTDLGAGINAEGTTFVLGDRDLVNLSNTEVAVGLSNIRVNTHRGADVVQIKSRIVPVSVNTGSGDDVIRISNHTDSGSDFSGDTTPITVDNIGAVNITDTLDQFETTADPGATGGSDVLTLDDSGDTTNNSAQITASQIDGMGLAGIVSYSGMNTVNIQTGSGVDTVRIRSTAKGVVYNLNTGAGDDFFRLGSIGSNQERGGGTVNGIDGVLNLDGSIGRNSILADDSGDTTNNSAIVTNSRISGMGMANVNYTGIFSIKLIFGSGNDSATNFVTSGTRVEFDFGTGE